MQVLFYGCVQERSHTRVSSDIDRVIGVTRVGARVRTLCLALLPVNHQLHPVAKFVGSDRVPVAVAEALPLRYVLRCNSSCSIVNMEQQLVGRNGVWKQ